MKNESGNAIPQDLIRDWYQPGHRVLFITGAGISVDSGLPTYRGVTGLYERQDTEDGVPIEVALSGDMLRRRPDLTWKYLIQIGKACQGKSFNRGHEIIVQLEQYFSEVWVLTQNIDGFHYDAGSKNLIEIHGTMRRLKCESCSALRDALEWDLDGYPPFCDRCENRMRPDVVLFGEMLPEKALGNYQRELAKGFDAVFIVGTTAVFPYISQPVHLFSGTDCLTVEINPEDTDLSGIVDIKLDETATKGLEEFHSCISALARS